MATQTLHFESIGHICATLQKPYGVIRRALAELGAEPAMVLNGVPHFAEADVERAAARLQQHRQCDVVTNPDFQTLATIRR